MPNPSPNDEHSSVGSSTLLRGNVRQSPAGHVYETDCSLSFRVFCEFLELPFELANIRIRPACSSYPAIDSEGVGLSGVPYRWLSAARVISTIHKTWPAIPHSALHGVCSCADMQPQSCVGP